MVRIFFIISLLCRLGSYLVNERKHGNELMVRIKLKIHDCQRDVGEGR